LQVHYNAGVTSGYEEGFGGRLRRLRLRDGLSQRDLAERAGLTQSTVLRLENEQVAPRPSTVRKLARALGCRPRDLTEPEQT
jgi:transcriptional regulator with XRE-family HTH domain